MSNNRRLILAIQSVLTRDLLSPEWQQRVAPTDHPTKGMCYVATEALWSANRMLTALSR